MALRGAARSTRRPLRTTNRNISSSTAWKKKKWKGASSAPSRPAKPMRAGRSRRPARYEPADGRPATRQSTAPTAIGRPTVVARCTNRPVPHHRRDPKVWPGHLPIDVVPTVVIGVTDHHGHGIPVTCGNIRHKTHPSQAATEDDKDPCQHRRPTAIPAAQEVSRQSVDEQEQRAGKDRRRTDEDGDREESGRPRRDGGPTVAVRRKHNADQPDIRYGTSREKTT